MADNGTKMGLGTIDKKRPNKNLTINLILHFHRVRNILTDFDLHKSLLTIPVFDHCQADPIGICQAVDWLKPGL